MTSLLSIHDLHVSFDTPRGLLQAVRGVDLDIPAGTSVGIVGESGSGKTVLSRAAMGLLQGKNVQRTGTVVFDGKELTAMPPDEVRNEFGTGMAMIFQDPMTALNPVRRIGSQISEGLRVRLGLSRADAMKRSAELLALVRIPDPQGMLRKFPNQLSGGMRQRAAIARALIARPQLVLADEPTGNVDPAMARRILRLLIEVHKAGAAVIVATHDLGLMDHCASARRLVLADGRLLVFE